MDQLSRGEGSGESYVNKLNEPQGSVCVCVCVVFEIPATEKSPLGCLKKKRAHVHKRGSETHKQTHTNRPPIAPALTFNSAPKLIPAHLPGGVSVTDHSRVGS